MCTRKDFYKAADLIKSIHCLSTRAVVINTFVAFFSQQNARFNKSRFLTACGVITEESC